MTGARSDGIVVVDKPAGLTSHQVVGRARRILGTRKVGHAGTLDPMATGVLVLGVNRATRLLGHLTLTDKTYRATIRLGATTVTDDAEGDLLTTPGAAHVTAGQVAEQLPRFTGEIDQVPSAVSAIKVDGQRSYARVRAGEEVTLASRRVTVHRFDLLDSRTAGEFLDLDVEVECSSGTYIRALARDLGANLGCGGHLTALRRTRVGPYDISSAQSLADDTTSLTVIAIDQVARDTFDVVEVDADRAADVGHGRRITLPGQVVVRAGSSTTTRDASTGADQLVAVCHRGVFLALYHPDGRPAAVFRTAQASGEGS
ncbi:tRNA pseudouridine(55) synthase TruB [Propionibacteriaceae bacterium Y2011]|uniref:tRNA pseudouridine(55) synthase TruB n=1 Tax=Microlunatus sp. Y2014 TaxID=3418488 RepID=UPI003B43F3D7